jgi:hypothetical protein
MGIFSFFNSQPKPTETPSASPQAFSTPFLKIGKGNLAAPYVNTFYTISGRYVRFGNDNLYPQLLNQLYFQSPIHAACVDFITNAVIGGGYEWAFPGTTPRERVEILTFEKKNRIKTLFKTITRDIVIHNRVTLLMSKMQDGSYKIKRLDPSTIRHNVEIDRVAYSPDWSRGEVGAQYYKIWYPGCKDKESVFLWQDDSPGQDIYALPGYQGSLNWCYLDSEQSFFHKQNIQNSVFPSIVIRRPKEFQSQDEIDTFREQLKMKQGAENSGSALVLTGQGFEQTPEVVFSASNPNDKVFMETAKECKEQICIAHKINPSIMGIKVQGSLGNAQELEMSYTIFEKNVVMPLKAQVEDIFGDIVDACGFNNTMIINDFQIIDRAIEKTEGNV